MKLARGHVGTLARGHGTRANAREGTRGQGDMGRQVGEIQCKGANRDGVAVQKCKGETRRGPVDEGTGGQGYMDAIQSRLYQSPMNLYYLSSGSVLVECRGYWLRRDRRDGVRA